MLWKMVMERLVCWDLGSNFPRMMWPGCECDMASQLGGVGVCGYLGCLADAGVGDLYNDLAYR